MLVRRADLDHGYIAFQGSAPVELLRLAQKHRYIVRVSALDAFAHICTYEESLVEKDPFEFRVSVGRLSFCVKVVDLYILELSCFASAAHGLDQNTGCACHAAQMYMVS